MGQVKQVIEKPWQNSPHVSSSLLDKYKVYCIVWQYCIPRMLIMLHMSVGGREKGVWTVGFDQAIAGQPPKRLVGMWQRWPPVIAIAWQQPWVTLYNVYDVCAA